jgi:hypothetical protein
LLLPVAVFGVIVQFTHWPVLVELQMTVTRPVAGAKGFPSVRLFIRRFRAET